uniref:Uncharacterized protein n=1 Tax=Panagrolaimus sp. PS1159 TaxID=55785 RepID=A0AC35GVN1_9BILA
MLTFSYASLFYLLNFLILVYAATPTPTTSQQCPCITAPGLPGCLQFDTRFQATSLDEAMNSFTDLTLDDSQKAPEEKNDIDCTSEQCKLCKEYLKKKLKDVGMLPASTVTSITANSTEQCKKYNFVRKGEIEKDSSDEDEDDDSSSSSKEMREIEKLKDKRDKILKKIEDHKHHLKRSRRQATLPGTDMGIDASVVGRRFKLSCDNKGVATDGSGLLTLCSRCWAWRELPDNYYPRYMNELVCDDSDGSCLSGYATCGISHRSAYVVRNDSGILNVITLQSGSFCECRVKPGTALESLVTGTGNANLPTNLPPINENNNNQQQQQQQSQGQPINNNVANSGNGFWY